MFTETLTLRHHPCSLYCRELLRMVHQSVQSLDWGTGGLIQTTTKDGASTYVLRDECVRIWEIRDKAHLLE